MKQILSLLCCMFILSGCITFSENYEKDSSDTFNVAQILRFQDLPVPSGYKVVETESFAFQNDVTRVCLLKYIGGGSPEALINFYKREMPLYNWSPINIIEYDKRILNFEKGSESCIVTIEAKGRKNIIVIALSPKSRPMKVESEE